MIEFQRSMQAPTEEIVLIQAAQAGDRAAFGELVQRHQRLICSVAYSATGDLALSEDLAQETFLAAWKNLSGLKEIDRLRPWLCGIARNLIANSRRRLPRDSIAGARSLHDLPEPASPQALPVQEAITAEEQQLLWRSLERIPEIYREPLILFYREAQSISRVSAALGLTEDTVKQRLSRGRKRLQAEVASFVAGALQRSTPGQAFTLAVLAALPAVGTTASAATVGLIKAQSAAAKSAVGLGALGAFLGPALGLFGGYLGVKASLANTQSARERRFVAHMAWLAAGGTALFAVGMYLLNLHGRAWSGSHPLLYALILAALVLTQITALFIAVFCGNRRQRAIRETEEKKPLIPPSHPSPSSAYEFRTKFSLLGLPFVHIKFGNPLGYGRGPARGWIAIGDTAVGVLLAVGGVAAGGISLGGFAVGLLPLGGAAFGLLALGGWAMGLEALGGGALAWHAAYGGLAIARHFAQGGLALAAHANDSAAIAYFESHWFHRLGRLLSQPSVALGSLLLVILLLLFLQSRSARRPRPLQS